MGLAEPPGGGDDLARLGLRLDARQYEEASKKVTDANREMTAAVERFEAATTKQQRVLMQAAAGRQNVARSIQSAGERQARVERTQAARRQVDARENARKEARAHLEGLEREFLANAARIREAQARGFLSARQARTEGREAAAAFNQGLVEVLDDARSGGSLRGGAGEQLFTDLAGRLKTVDDGARSAGAGIHRLNNSLVVMARQATGAHPILGQLTDVVGTFAIGTARMVPILAGIAAIGFGIRAVARDALEGRRAVRSLQETIRDLEAGPADDLQRVVDTVRGRQGAFPGSISGPGPSGPGATPGGLESDFTKAALQAAQNRFDTTERLVRRGTRRITQIEREAAQDQLRIYRRGIERRLAAERAEQEEAEKIAKERREAWNREEQERFDFIQQIQRQIRDAQRRAAEERRRDEEKAAEEREKTEREIGQKIVAEVERIRRERARIQDEQRREREQALRDEAREIERVAADTARVLQRLLGGTLGALAGGLARATGRALGAQRAAGQSRDLIGALQEGVQANQIGIAVAAAEAVVGRAGKIFFGLDAEGLSDAERSRILSENTRALESVTRSIDEWGERVAGLSAAQVEDFRSVLGFLNNGGSVRTDRLRGAADFFGIDISDRNQLGPGGTTNRALAQAIEAALAEAFEVVQRTVGSDFAARAADLEGDVLEATRIRRQAAADAELRELEQLAAAGFITSEQFATMARVLEDEVAAALREVEEQAQRAARSLEADLIARGLEATGQSDAAARARLTFAQRQERQQVAGSNPELLILLDFVQSAELDSLIRQQEAAEQSRAIQDAAAEQQRALDEQIRLQSEQLQVAHDALREQQQQVAATSRMVDSLTAFESGLLLGGRSPLSPTARLAEAQRQFNEARRLALGGDLDAAGRIPGLGGAVIDASRRVNASGLGFVADFNFVRDTVGQIRADFEGRLTVEERMLEQLEQQTESMQAQIDALHAARDKAAQDAADQLAALEERIRQAEQQAAEHLKELQDTRDLWERNTGDDGSGRAWWDRFGDDITFKPLDDTMAEARDHMEDMVNVSAAGFAEVVDRLEQVHAALLSNTNAVRRGGEVVE